MKDDRTLFDEPESEWREVPAARFLSWTLGEQLAYCAARDDDSARTATDLPASFYSDRADAYLLMMVELERTK